MSNSPDSRPIVGCLLGTAVGDALGLPYEGLSPRRAARLLGPPERYRLLGRWGLVSDDTEHSCLVARALIASAEDPLRFRRALAWGLRLWFLGLPAGIGWATLRAIVKLWIGIPSDRSGVHSAGNGPAMRAAIIGVAVTDPLALRAFVRASSRLTHTDPRAEQGAFAIALAACLAAGGVTVEPDVYLDELRSALGPEAETLTGLVARAAESARRGETTASFAVSLGLGKGVSGYVLHSVPVALQAWFAHPRDFRAALAAVIRCGGDTDTTAAMVGGILGAALGPDGIPAEWRRDLRDWPRSVGWMERLGEQLARCRATGATERPLRLPLFGVLLRNGVFLLIVFTHGLRRLLPPY